MPILNGKIWVSRAKVIMNMIHEMIVERFSKGEFDSSDTDNYNDIWELVDLWLYLDRKEHNRLALIGMVNNSIIESNALLEYEEIKHFCGYSDIIMFSIADFILNGVRSNEFIYNKDSDIDKALFRMSIDALNIYYDEVVVDQFKPDMTDYYKAIKNINAIVSEWRDIATFRIRALAYGIYKGFNN